MEKHVFKGRKNRCTAPGCGLSEKASVHIQSEVEKLSPGYGARLDTAAKQYDDWQLLKKQVAKAVFCAIEGERMIPVLKSADDWDKTPDTGSGVKPNLLYEVGHVLIELEKRGLKYSDYIEHASNATLTRVDEQG